MTVGPIVRRVRDGVEIEDLCEAHQPAALLVSSPLNEPQIGARARSWIVGRRGEEVGAVTTVDLGAGQVSASTLLLQPEGAPVLAHLVRRSRATSLRGGAGHVGPVADLLPGARPFPLELLVMGSLDRRSNPDGDLQQAELRRWVRAARATDLPALVELYRRFPLEFLADAQLAPALAGLVRQHRVFVVEVDGVIVGAQRIEAQSRHWNLWAGLTILPEHRGKGLSRWFDRLVRDIAKIEHRASSGVRALTNAVPHTLPGTQVEPWLEVRLAPDPSVPARARRWARRQVRTRAPWAGAAR